jgi:multicomponent Na+:H+ antiporter subunit E
MVLIQRPYLRLTLTLLWMALHDEYTVSSFVAGLIVATLVQVIFPGPVVVYSRFRFGSPLGFLRWLGKTLKLITYFGVELAKSNWDVLKRVLAPKIELTPGILAMELRAQNPAQVALLAALITLTPGTLTVEVTEENDVMYIHAIDARDPEGALAVPRRFEEMIMEVIAS